MRLVHPRLLAPLSPAPANTPCPRRLRTDCSCLPPHCHTWTTRSQASTFENHAGSHGGETYDHSCHKLDPRLPRQDHKLRILNSTELMTFSTTTKRQLDDVSQHTNNFYRRQKTPIERETRAFECRKIYTLPSIPRPTCKRLRPRSYRVPVIGHPRSRFRAPIAVEFPPRRIQRKPIVAYTAVIIFPTIGTTLLLALRVLRRVGGAQRFAVLEDRRVAAFLTDHVRNPLRLAAIRIKTAEGGIQCVAGVTGVAKIVRLGSCARAAVRTTFCVLGRGEGLEAGAIREIRRIANL